MAQAETDVILSLYVGESFVEAHLSHNQKSIHFNRWYLGKEGFKSGLQKFFQEAGVAQVQKAYVASRFVEKIFAYRLGGSVATLTTKGFENWPGMRQPTNLKVGPLSSVDLLFAIDERCSADGILETELSDAEVTETLEKLRQKQAKRVCIHFLNASKNPHNQNKMKEALLKENFEVFTPTVTAENADEVSEWRKNILNASLSGTFAEVQDELNEGLKAFLPEGQRASFYAADGTLFDRENHQRLSSLWGAFGIWTQALRKKHASEKFDVLYLGLEQFNLLNPLKQNQVWNSPWGVIHAPQVQNQVLSLQPTTSIEIDAWGELAFSKNALGYEPGPMFMGRGQVPTFLDLWSENTADLKGVADRRSPQGLQKFKNQLWALNKTSNQQYDSEAKLLTSLQNLAMQKLGMEITLRAENKKIYCLGALAPLFVSELKKRLPQFQLELLPETETSLLLNQGSAHVI
ncbi:hydantoinase/oxoprolinase N-terminal domain-containing protein [Bdellovibrio sp. HCB337]|uniref:hydantoinase/oxoprolinase N-terminal domain-containing protein n=1 Tax=Bdellovibrio sp. HCB337 TaxID=3394358 RepID=UPI0039A5ED22